MWKKANLCNKQIECISCEHNYFCGSWTEFVNNHGDVKTYAHFDKRVSLRMTPVRQYVMEPGNIITLLAPGIFNHKNAGDFNQIPPELSGQFLPK